MSQPVRVFVDARPVDVPADSTVAAAAAAGDPALAAALRDGLAYVTDGVGRAIDPSTTVFPGAIYRVVRSARRGRNE